MYNLDVVLLSAIIGRNAPLFKGHLARFMAAMPLVLY